MNRLLKLTAMLMITLQSFVASAQQEASGPVSHTPWHIALHATAGQEHITFLSRGMRLNGTLYYPLRRQPGPAVVVLHGASSPSQSLPLYAHLEQILPPLGIAVLVFDRRGAGMSGSDNDQYDFQILAEDGVAARNALSGNPHVDGTRIGYWGISQGGWLAIAAATIDRKAAFVISVSAPVTTPDVQMNFAVANILRIHGYGQNEIATALNARRAVDEYLRGKLNRATAEHALNAARNQPWFPLIYMNDTVSDPGSSSWLKQMRFDPAAILDKVSAPVLMVYGQDDPWVPVQLSLRRLRTIVQLHPNVDATVVAGADHTMMLGIDPKDQVDPNFFPKEAPNAPAYFALLGAWLAHHGFAMRTFPSDW